MENNSRVAITDYSLVKSRRRSISVEISADGKVIVRCPYSATARDIEKFLGDKSSWICRKVEERKGASDMFADVCAYKKILAGGETVPFEIGKCNGVFDGRVCVTSVNRLKALYVKEYGEKFLSDFEAVRARYGFKPTGVNFRDYKSRWGCCDIKGQITFNYKLLMLPKELQFYVIAHELCHLLVFDHSPAFRRELQKIDSEWHRHRKELQLYSCIIRLY